MSLAIDPWADSPLGQDQPVPGPATRALTKGAADTLCDDIQSDVARSLQNDPPLQSDLLAKTLTELANAAANGSAWAASLLESLWHRSRSGVPYGEPQEPAWSLDPEPRDRPYEITLSDGDGDLG